MRANVPVAGYPVVFAKQFGLLLFAATIAMIGATWALRLIWRGPREHAPLPS